MRAQSKDCVDNVCRNGRGLLPPDTASVAWARAEWWTLRRLSGERRM